MGPLLLLADPPHLPISQEWGLLIAGFSSGANEAWAPLEDITHPYSTLEAKLGSLAGKGETEEKAKHPQGYRLGTRENLGSHTDPRWETLGAKKIYRLSKPV